MASTESSDYRERKDRERGKSPIVSNGSLHRQSSRNVRMNNIESSVTRLLVATKQLIETLTLWSRRQATETDVSDVYVKLGNEFNIARTCFERAGIEMAYSPSVDSFNDSDLADIPSQLRQVLETCLARDASTRVLEIYLPKVREIVINLLQGLKRKQARYRARSQDNADEDSKEAQPPVTAKERRKNSPARRPVGGRDESVERKLPREPPKDSSVSIGSPGNSQPAIITQMASPVIESPVVPTNVPTNDALQKLQTSDALQRRASKRYSAYNFAKLDGENGPPPVPSRSGSYSPDARRSPSIGRAASPRRRSPDKRPMAEPLPEEDESTDPIGEFELTVDSRPSSIVRSPEVPDEPVAEPQSRGVSPEKIPVFLQLGSSVRKYQVSLTDFTLQSLRLLFVEKFQFNPGADTFPDILITDRETGVRYILEDSGVQDIIDGTMFTLDVEVDSTIKKTFNDGIGTLLKEMATLQRTISSQQTLLTRLSEQHMSLREDLTSHRHETIRKIEDISLKSPSLTTSPSKRPLIQPHLSTIKSLKRDLLNIRSEHTTFVQGINSSLSKLRSLPYSSAVQVITGDDLAPQKADLESKTQALVTLSDDLSDLVDDLRIDITQKRIRPHPRSIAAVRKSEEKVQKELESVETLLRSCKPVWKRKWEDELQQVIDGQEFLRHQETLITDLRKDLQDTNQVITHVVQAAELFESKTLPTREWLSGGLGSGGREVSREAVLGEVKTLQPNSEERLEAIKRAERNRIRDLEMRRENEFQEELGQVVTENKLKGQGVMAERLEKERGEKEKKIRQELWESSQKLKQTPNTNGNGNSSGPMTIVPVKENMAGVGDQEKAVKRAVSEGSFAFANVVASSAVGSDDDGVGRSQSHSSGLARMKRVSGNSLKLFSGNQLEKSNSISEGSVSGGSDKGIEEREDVV